MRARAVSAVLLVIVLAGILLSAESAFAQGPPASSPAFQVPASDLSLQVLGRVFGEAPAGLWPAAGQSDSPLGLIFQTLCASLLTLAVFWTGYNVVRATIATAEEGTFLGRRISSVWMPVRFVIGVSMLTPLFPVPGGAWCGAQVAMAWFSKMGIALANGAARAGVGFMTTYNPANASAGANHRQLAEAMYLANLCMEALNRDRDTANRRNLLTVFTPDVSAFAIDTPSSVGYEYRYPLFANGQPCGRVTVDFPDNTTSTISFDSGPFGAFDNNNRNNLVRAQQQAIRAQIRSSLATLQAGARSLAQSTVDSYANATAAAAPVPVVDPAALDTLARQYSAALATAAASSSQAIAGPMAAAVRGEIGTKGWMALGAWYQSVAMMSTEVQKIVDGTPTIKGPTLPDRIGSYTTIYAGTTGAHRAASDLASGNEADANVVLRPLFGPMVNLTASVARTMGTWGDTTHPLLAMKNFGDALTTAGATGMAAIALMNATAKAAEESAPSRIAALGGVSPMTWIRGVLDVIGPYLMLAILALFFFGVTLAIYIPMLPFMVFFGGIIGWLAIQAEALVAAPLGAFAHLDIEGEGMGSRTQHAYLFVVNVLFRPVLMVIGFFIANGVVIALGWLLNTLFAPAVANVQFSTWTGIVSFIGFLFVYWMLALLLVTQSFHLITLVPDKVLGWLGHGGDVRLGADIEDRGKGIFAAALFQTRNIFGGGGGGRKRMLPSGKPPLR